MCVISGRRAPPARSWRRRLPFRICRLHSRSEPPTIAAAATSSSSMPSACSCMQRLGSLSTLQHLPPTHASVSCFVLFIRHDEFCNQFKLVAATCDAHIDFKSEFDTNQISKLNTILTFILQRLQQIQLKISNNFLKHTTFNLIVF